MSTELTLLSIHIYISIYSIGYVPSFPCFDLTTRLVNSVRIFLLFSRNDSPSCHSLQPPLTILQASVPTWYISTHNIFSSGLGSNISCYRLLIHGTSCHLLSHSSFTPDSAPEFSDATPWLSPIFNSLPFSLFIVDNLPS